jgi:hypothetical protein
MKKFLFAALLLGFLSPVKAGIPQDKKEKYTLIVDSDISKVYIDLNDVEIKGGKMRFYIERVAKDASKDGSNRMTSYKGKQRVDCNNFTARTDAYTGGMIFTGGYLTGIWQTMSDNELSYQLANYLCYLTGIEGYTPEPNPPKWVSTIIENYNSKPKKKSSGVINCNSPVHRNKPQCFDY